VEKILAAPVGNSTVANAIAETIAKVGENMTLRRAAELSVGKGVVASYVHNSVTDGLGRIGVIVALDSAGKADELKAFGRMVAMHVASANPQAVDSSGLAAATIEREKNVLADKAKASGKPANVVEKIVESGLKTFYKEVCLLDQGFIFDDKKSVAQALKESETSVGAPIKIAGFVRFALGEGIDRPSGDFSGEVAALAGAH
jgi:elongation factor Ts